MRTAQRLKTLFVLTCALGGLAAGPLSNAETRGPTPLAAPAQTQGKLYEGSYALLIGVSQYEDAHWPSLDSVSQELGEIEALLEDLDFTVVRVDNPDKSQLQAEIEKFVNRYGIAPSKNRLLFYFAGHGDTLDGEGYLVPRDAPDPAQDKVGFLSKAYSMIDIMAWARKIKAVHALFLFDSCFSGTIFQTRDKLPELPAYIAEDALEPVRQFISAGKAGETVPARSDFAAEFINALRHRKADYNRDGYVTGLELGTYLNGEVKKYHKQIPQYGKIADPKLNVGDFIFTVGQAVPLPSVAAPPSDSDEDITRSAIKDSIAASNMEFDIKFVIDMSDYMEPYVEGIRLSIINLAKQAGANDINVNMNFGIVGYFQSQNGIIDLTGAMRRINDFSMFTNLIRTYEKSEAYVGSNLFSAVVKAINSPWSENSLRFIVIISKSNSYTIEPDNKTGLSAKNIRELLDVSKIQVISIHLKNKQESYAAEFESQLSALSLNSGDNPPAYMAVDDKEIQDFSDALGSLTMYLMASLSAIRSAPATESVFQEK